MMKTHLKFRRNPRSSVNEQVPYVAIVVLLTACRAGALAQLFFVFARWWYRANFRTSVDQNFNPVEQSLM